LPKGTCFTDVDDELLRGIEEEMNESPRKRLGYKWPTDYFSKLLTVA